MPVAIGMVLAQAQRQCRRGDGSSWAQLLALVFIAFIAISWVPRNWQFLLTTTPATYVAAIGLGVFGIAIGYAFARALKLHPRNAAPHAWRWKPASRTGRWPIAIIAFTFSFGDEAQSYMAVPALYSLFIVIVSTLVTLVFRRANTAAEHRMPDGLL